MKRSKKLIFFSLSNWMVILEKEIILLTNLTQKLFFLILVLLWKNSLYIGMKGVVYSWWLMVNKIFVYNFFLKKLN
jgi:hypothetical protein